ncbi:MULTISPECIES: hypothetical protein [unclassified Janthinobacterium]|uniref:hypothetical protein n=1 Tax=unclassified Janthinobacterium TaxID=2610881 RepID=UPI0008843D96|nr:MULTISPECIES: hypothetical protein [unclassified Janthinobacterium]SDA48985.1 hypothetical protein SAMN03159349_01415 [Janthinobacterium sp. 551a]SFB41104.1 hypothetical protein SAMN03159300_104236 [Janthinobacterium sp. 344]
MNKHVLIFLLAMPLAISHAYAEEVDGPAVKISGYGTAALTVADTDNAQFARPNQASGAGRTARTGVDSNLGVQANVTVNAWLSATVQGLARKDGENDFGAELAWAFAKAKVSDSFSVRVGRMGLPVFMISDYRNVGYANTMLRPPGEMYSQVPLNSIDGIDGTYQFSAGDTSVTTQLALGRTKATLATGPDSTVHVEGKSIVALNVVAEHGPLTVRFGRAETKLSIDDSPSLNTLMGSLRAAGSGYKIAQLGALADALEVQDKKASFTSVGLGLDWNSVLLQSEYAKRKTDSYVSDSTSWYVMGGYRMGAFLPYYSYASLKADGRVNNTVPAACPAGYPAACTPTLRALSAGVDTLAYMRNQLEQSTHSIGVRWDFHRSAALKVQIDRIQPKNGPGLFVQAKPGFHGPVTVAAAAIDFVF